MLPCDHFKSSLFGVARGSSNVLIVTECFIVEFMVQLSSQCDYSTID